LIVIIDYEVGNVASVANMLNRIGQTQNVISRHPDIIRKADRIILPGVGAFDKGMRNLRELGLIDSLNVAAMERKVPVLGICLGMHLLTASSDEGTEPGLGWIDGTTHRFDTHSNPELKVPHMGWNYADPKRENPLIPMGSRPRFYFVHGYYVEMAHVTDVVATTSYGAQFPSAISHDNVFGVQFHPEKSHRFGLELLRRFAAF
jgi:glutamine amidotransferase